MGGAEACVCPGGHDTRARKSLRSLAWLCVRVVLRRIHRLSLVLCVSVGLLRRGCHATTQVSSILAATDGTTTMATRCTHTTFDGGNEEGRWVYRTLFVALLSALHTPSALRARFSRARAEWCGGFSCARMCVIHVPGGARSVTTAAHGTTECLSHTLINKLQSCAFCALHLYPHNIRPLKQKEREVWGAGKGGRGFFYWAGGFALGSDGVSNTEHAFD